MTTPENALAAFETKELVAELRKRRGVDTTAIEDLGKAIDELDLGSLGAIKRQVDALWEHKTKNLTRLTAEEKAMLAGRDYIGCVKSVRERVGVGLADAKALVDKWKGEL